jgi:hypothetical protein
MMVVNAVMNLEVPQNAGNFLAEDLLASQEGLYSMELLTYQLLNKMLYIIKLQGTQRV